MIRIGIIFTQFLLESFLRTNAKVMEKSCQPQTEQMCNPPKKQPTQEKVHQVDQEVNQQIILIDELNKEVNVNDVPTLCSAVCVCVAADLSNSQEKCLHHDDKGNMVHASTHPAPTYSG